MVTKKIPLRRCIATGEQCAKKDLIRVVRNKENGLKITDKVNQDINSKSKNKKWREREKNRTC